MILNLAEYFSKIAEVILNFAEVILDLAESFLMITGVIMNISGFFIIKTVQKTVFEEIITIFQTPALAKGVIKPAQPNFH